MDYQAYREQLQRCCPTPSLAFEPSEYEGRLTQVRQSMVASELDVLLLTDPGELCYLTGYTTFEVSVQCVLLVSAQCTVLFVPAIEIGPAVYLSRVDEVVGYPWQSPDGVARQLAGQIAAIGGPGSPRVGFDPWAGSLRPGLLSALRAQPGGARLVEVSAFMDPVRRVKSSAELAYLSESGVITGAGLDAAAAVIDEGVIDHQIAQAGAGAMLGLGSEFMSMQPIVTTGARSGIIHTNHAGHTVVPGDVVFTEFGSVRRRYTAPMMRTAVVGRASDEMREFHRVCLDVLHAVMAAMRAGEPIAAAAQAGAQAMESITDRAFFSGVFGYPVGAAFPPSWVAGSSFITCDNPAFFEPDMVFHLPICLRKPGEFGMGFSETVRVTPGGGERLTKNNLSLDEIGS